MKNRLLSIAGSVAVLLVCGFMLPGCGTTGGGRTPPSPDKQAERLAADLNAVKAGTAAVEGATVTLIGNVGLETALTVPAGVTLDLTADGARFELKDGAILTVNGTVNTSGHGDHGKGWVDGGLLIDNGAAIINGSGTLRLSSKGSLLNIGRSRKLTLDGVTLVGLEDNDNSLVQVGEGGELVLKSGAITGNTRVNEGWSSGGGVRMYKGTFTMEGGEIFGNSAVSNKEGSGGGGVEVGEGSVFTMKGGLITGNTADRGRDGHGGGVRVSNGTFTMEDGSISGNSVGTRGVDSGGGVEVGKGSVFTMTGGVISENTAGDATVLVVDGSTFIMKSGAITGNNKRGVHVRNETTTFVMEGGEISGNNGQGVAVHDGAFTMKGGVIHGNTSSEGGGVAVWGDCLFEMYGGRIQGDRDSDGFTRNTSTDGKYSALRLAVGRSKWGTGGTYTIGGVPQPGGSVIAPLAASGWGGTNDTLIAIPAP